MARWIAGAIAAGGDGLTDEICALAADTAARRLDWRIARENIVMTSRVIEAFCDQLLMQKEDERRWVGRTGALRSSEKLSP